MAKFHKGPIILLAIAVALLAAACGTSSNEPVEFEQQADLVVIQAVTVRDDATAAQRRVTVPDFTLYGDGTLIFKRTGQDGTRLQQASLPPEAAQVLLEEIVSENFLDFSFSQPAPPDATGETAFLYARTAGHANAAGIRVSGDPLIDEAGGDFSDYRTIQALVALLRALDPVSAGGTEPAPYVPERYLMVSESLDGTGRFSERETIPSEASLLAAKFADGADPSLEELAGPVALPVTGGSDQAIYFAPLLPYRENFPVFDLQ